MRNRPETDKRIDWTRVRRVLVIRLRSIGDTVLATPSLIALKRFLPHADIEILLEDWVAPVLDGTDFASVLTVSKSLASRAAAVSTIRGRKYDVVFNLHGGSTSALITGLSGARHRVGYEDYRYASVYNHRLSSSAAFWGRSATHSAEQQLALVGFAGVPVDDRQRTRLSVTNHSLKALIERRIIPERPFALIHPASAFFTKRWPISNYAQIAEYLAAKRLSVVAIASPAESHLLSELTAASAAGISAYDDLSLPEITALASRAEIFIGNDSGIAHIAAAVNTPAVVIFGSSNRVHWHPWTDTPNEIVFTPFECQPCPGYECAAYGEPRCILEIPPEQVFAAVDRVLEQAAAIRGE